MSNRYAFVGGEHGRWSIRSITSLCGAPVLPARALSIVPFESLTPDLRAEWTLQGLVSNVRYATRSELVAMRASQSPLDRPEALTGVLIPIKKSADWWALAQDERRQIFEEASHHTKIGMNYLPAIARQLFHSRDINEPFDFLTWFEFAPEHEPAFDDLLRHLRATHEWRFVEREVEIRVDRM